MAGVVHHAHGRLFFRLPCQRGPRKFIVALVEFEKSQTHCVDEKGRIGW
jgi:hypothetical protein